MPNQLFCLQCVQISIHTQLISGFYCVVDCHEIVREHTQCVTHIDIFFVKMKHPQTRE